MASPHPVRRLTVMLFISQGLASAGFFAAATVNTIAGKQLSGHAELATLPLTVYLIGSALAAYPASQIMGRWGRRPGLALGFAIGVVGAVIAGMSILWIGFWTFVVGAFLTGTARGALDLSRYAAAEMQPTARRARAISLIVLAGLVGSILGREIVDRLGQLVQARGYDPLFGAWLGTGVLFFIGLLGIQALLRPDPASIGRLITAAESVQGEDGPVRRLGEIFQNWPARVALLAMVFGQAVMVMLMVITPLHMSDQHHGLGEISSVFLAHTFGMFGLSGVAGWLADSLGRSRTIVLGASLLVASSLFAPAAQSTLTFALTLFLLGWGWNLCYVAGSTLLTDVISPSERGSVQGTADLIVNAASAVGTLGSGLVFAAVGYAAMGLICAAASFLPLSVAGWLTRVRPARPATGDV